MENTIKELDGCKREIEITLTNDELKPHFEDAYKEAQKSIDMKGFRKGKVPMNLVKQYYGKRIEAESLETICDDEFRKIIKEKELPVVGQPSLFHVDRTDEGVVFKISYEVLPDFELADYRGLTIDEPIHTVTEEELQLRLNEIAKANGKMEPDEFVNDENHIVGIKLTVIDPQSLVPIIGEKPIDTHVYLANETVMPDLRASLLNTKVGDTFNFQPKEADNSAPDKTYKVEVTEIQKLVPIELTDEFVKQYTSGNMNTYQELKDELEFQMQDEWNHKSRTAMEDQIVNKIVEMNSLSAPESIVSEVAKNMAEDIKKRYSNMPDAANLSIDSMVPGLLPVAEKTVKWEIIRKRIIENEKLEVEDFDLDNLVEAEAARSKSDPDTVRRAIMQNRAITENILHKKLMDFILDFAITNEVQFDEHGHYHPDGEEHHHHEHEHEHEHEHKH
ncbi:MAG: trigger factor [Ignavibacteriae bacterium]|nr:trigger factor [Ignavibacteriota bacterium]